MIESDLYAHLVADASLATLVNGRIYPLTAPQNVVKPYITYRVISDNNEQCLGGAIYSNDVRFQIDVWSEKYSTAKAIKTAVVNAINGFKSSYSLILMDDYEDETSLYRQMIDFKLKG